MKTLIESCFCLSTNLLKKDLRKARNKEKVEGKFLNYRRDGRPCVLFYSVEYDFNDKAYLVVAVGAEPQRILLSEHWLTFGTRTYLTCACLKRTNALYLHKSDFLACRNCHDLRYEVSTIHNKGDYGRVLYRANKRIRLVNMRADMSHIFYKNKYTRRFQKWLRLCEEAGLNSEVKSTTELLRAIHSQ